MNPGQRRSAVKTIFNLLLIVWFLLAGNPYSSFAQDTSVDPELSGQQQELQEQIQEMGKELSRVIIENLQTLLDKELNRLKKTRRLSEEELKQRFENLSEIIRNNPDSGHAFFELGELYHQIGDGANAIISMKQAESVFIKAKNIKGAAEARRNLRMYYSKYDFQPEDFVLFD